ncbi:MAG: MazG nucleotide pyrophosphohydrolase domain-containing protein [Nocardioidaceae bacterium]
MRYLLEETYETVDAIESGDRDHLREELGDLLLQVAFHARIGSEDPDNPFGIDEVAAGDRREADPQTSARVRRRDGRRCRRRGVQLGDHQGHREGAQLRHGRDSAGAPRLEPCRQGGLTHPPRSGPAERAHAGRDGVRRRVARRGALRGGRRCRGRGPRPGAGPAHQGGRGDGAGAPARTACPSRRGGRPRLG